MAAMAMKKMSFGATQPNVWRPRFIGNGYVYTAARQDHLKAFSLSNGMLSSTWVYESTAVLHPYRVPTLSAKW